MNREDFYFNQQVTELELDTAFEYCEQADQRIISDQGLFGIFSGGEASERVSGPDLTIDLSGPCYAYDQLGQRCSFAGPVLNKDLSVDSNSVSTAVAGVGNEKWLSVFLQFDRVLSDPRVDGNSQVVQFQRAESFKIVVVQGTEQTAGSASRPALLSNGILLCDVNRYFGQTQIVDADISITRRQDTFVFTGPPGGLSIRAGTPGEAVEAMLDALNSHILGLASPQVVNNRALSMGSKFEPTGGELWTLVQGGGGYPDYCFIQTDTTGNGLMAVEVTGQDIPNGVTINEVRASLKGNASPLSGHVAKPLVMPTLTLIQVNPATGVKTVIGFQQDTSANQTVYDAQHFVAISGLAHVVDRTKRYLIVLNGETSTNSIAGRLGLLGLDASWTAP